MVSKRKEYRFRYHKRQFLKLFGKFMGWRYQYFKWYLLKSWERSSSEVEPDLSYKDNLV